MKTRTIIEQVPPTACTYLNNEWIDLENGWFNLDGAVIGITDAIGYESTIDLSGYQIQEKTFFPSRQTIQTAGPYVGYFPASGHTGGVLSVTELISQVPLDIDRVWADMQSIAAGQRQTFPSFIDGQGEFSDMILGRWRLMGTNQLLSVGESIHLTLQEEWFGSGEPTAADMLYVYVIIEANVTKADGDYMRIPPSRMILGGSVGTEKELEYMMRLRRSYALDQ